MKHYICLKCCIGIRRLLIMVKRKVFRTSLSLYSKIFDWMMQTLFIIAKGSNTQRFLLDFESYSSYIIEVHLTNTNDLECRNDLEYQVSIHSLTSIIDWLQIKRYDQNIRLKKLIARDICKLKSITCFFDINKILIFLFGHSPLLMKKDNGILS